MTNTHSLRIGWVGFHEEGELAFEALIKHGYKVCGAVTLDTPSADKRSARSDYLSICEDLGIPLHKTGHINNQETVDWLSDLDLDLLVVLGWSQILSARVLSLPKIGVIGAHASLLPRLKGSAPVNWAIIKGMKRTGNTLIELVEHVDQGKIIDQTEFPIETYDSCRTLYQKVAESNAKMLLSVLPEIECSGSLPGVPQKVVNEKLLPRRTPSDGLIDWSESATDIYNLIRAVTRPYPGAFTYLNDKKAMVWSSSLLPVAGITAAVPGEIIGPVYSESAERCGLLVQCGESSVLIVNELEIDNRVFFGAELADLGSKKVRFGEKL